MFHVKHDAIDEAAGQLGLDLDGVRGRLEAYAVLLRDRAAPMGLISAADAGDALERHILDCLRASPHLAGGTAAVDIGSGVGLPGIPVAIARPDVSVTLLDARARRVAFLELVAEELDLANVAPVHVRVEAFAGRADACLARAFAPLPRSWTAASRILRPGGRLIFFAGASVAVEEAASALHPAPSAVRAVPPPAVLASAGPLVIMTLQ